MWIFIYYLKLSIVDPLYNSLSSATIVKKIKEICVKWLLLFFLNPLKSGINFFLKKLYFLYSFPCLKDILENRLTTLNLDF